MSARCSVALLRIATRIAALAIACIVLRPVQVGAAPITTCGVIADAINAPAQVRTWTFTGTAGEQVLLTAVKTSGALDTRLQLVSPTAVTEAQSVCDAFGCRDQLNVVLNESGTYTLLVSDNGNNDTGTYDLTLFRFSGPTTCAEDLDGSTLACDEHVSGTISSPADIDGHHFAGTAGDRVFLRAVKTSGALDTRMQVFAPGDTIPEVLSVCDAFGCRDQLEFQLAKSGTYTVLVHDGGLAQSGTYDFYVFQLPCTPGPSPDPDTGPMACEQSRSGSASPGYEVDHYTFEATAGERVFVTATKTTGALDTRVRAFPPGGGPAQVGSVCDAFGCRDQLEFVPAVTGTYTVLVEDGGGVNTGQYVVSLFRLPCVDPSPADRDTGVFISDLTRHGAVDRLHDFDPYRFYGEVGWRVVISAVKETGPLDTRLRLYPPDGGPLEAITVCDAFGCRDHLEVTLAQTGVYTLLVHDGGSVQKGGYQLTLTKLPGSATSIDDMDGGSIVSGDLVSARIQVASDRDAWRFYGSAGQRAIVTATKTDGALDTRLAVFPPGSGAAEAQSVCDAFGCRDQLDFVLAQSGLYTITVTDENGTRRGDYNLSLILIPDTPEIGFYHLLPADGQAVAPLQTLGFSWDPVPGATSYEVYLTSDPLGPVPNVASGLLTPGFTTPVLDLDTQYFWRVEANTPGGIVRGPDRRFYAVSSTTDAPPAPTLTGEVALAPARPNPFRAGTQLTLTVPSRTAVSLRVFDLHGRLVRTLHEGPLEAGEHPFDWDGRDGRGSRVPPGLYLCSAGVGETTRLRKLCVLE